jgi:hypothetical protein
VLVLNRNGQAIDIRTPQDAFCQTHEAGLKLLAIPRAPKELPVTAHLRNAHGVA